jgi:hypothetical protein
MIFNIRLIVNLHTLKMTKRTKKKHISINKNHINQIGHLIFC